eukprot:TRINITY_DN21639_c0_g1_i1.p1 TRINITY_DN21639_c0_g1~~TRINITY_DN21639_c0_g1_i1.p1  ORF type:complete len:457 (-),score=43.59 TRINITY_DN21639_c0_g1_i1:457-1827(-)
MTVDIGLHAAFDGMKAYLGYLGGIGYLLYPFLLVLYHFLSNRARTRPSHDKERLPWWAYEMCFAFSRCVVRAIRLSFWLFWQQYAYLLNDPCRRVRTFDGHHVHDGINLNRHIRYSNVHQVETMDIMHPKGDFASLGTDKVPIVYVHGGGFVAATSELELQSLGFMVRAGYSIYSLDYPLAPENKYPVAQLSVLRALDFLKKNYSVERVILMGDSAGACLAGMAAALVENRPLLQQLADATGEPLSEMTFPEIESLVLVYGVLDSKASLVNAPLPLEMGLKFMYDCYAPEAGSPLENAYTLCDVMENVDSLPKCFLMGAEYDPVFPSTLACYQALKEKNLDCNLKIYPASHAFMGFPFMWPLSKTFQQCCVNGHRDVLDFLAGRPFREGDAIVPAKFVTERVVGILEVADITGVLPVLIWMVAGHPGLAAWAAVHLVVSLAGIALFYFRHSRFPEH